MTRSTEDTAKLWRLRAEKLSRDSRALAELGDLVSSQLRQVRSDVLAEAAALLLSRSDPDVAAQEMMQRAGKLTVTTPPAIGMDMTTYDRALVDYTQARTWQRLAREIQPALREVQPRWDE